MAHNSQRVPWHLFRRDRTVTAADGPHAAAASPSDSPSLSHRQGADQQRRRQAAFIACHGANQQRQRDTAALVAALCDALQHDIRHEAARHLRAAEPPADADLVIADPVARTIAPLVRAWRAEVFAAPGLEGVLDLDDAAYHAWRLDFARAAGGGVFGEEDEGGWPGDDPDPDDDYGSAIMPEEPPPPRPRSLSARPCRHDPAAGFRCGCLLPRSERTAAAFRRGHPGNSCYTFREVCAKEYFDVLVMQSLLLADEMRPFCHMGRGETSLYVWESVAECNCVGFDSIGWGRLQTSCLMSYIYLNALLSLSGADGAGESLLSSSQYQNRATTGTLLQRFETSDWLGRALHAEFHGDATTRPPASLWERVPGPSLRLGPAAEAAAREALTARGLPEEIVLQVLHARLPRSPIRVPGDPLHPDNRKAVEEYLDLCWGVVVRCGVLQAWNPAAAGAGKLSWASHVGSMVRDLQVKLWKEVEVTKCEAPFHA